MAWMTNPEGWIALATLAVLEIVLGIDNIIFISIMAEKLPAADQARARLVGLGMAMGVRILLLLSISWVVSLTEPLITLPFSWMAHEMAEVTGRDLIMLGGGLFLLAKSTHEIHMKLEGHDETTGEKKATVYPSFASVIVQIMLLDIIFSLDSVITAVGMARDVSIMITAVIIAVGVMMWFSGPISTFVSKHPTVKMLALSFLLLIGMTLVADGLGQEIQKAYVYFAIAFSAFVEMLNLRLRKSSDSAVKLHESAPGA